MNRLNHLIIRSDMTLLSGHFFYEMRGIENKHTNSEFSYESNEVNVGCGQI